MRAIASEAIVQSYLTLFSIWFRRADGLSTQDGRVSFSEQLLPFLVSPASFQVEADSVGNRRAQGYRVGELRRREQLISKGSIPVLEHFLQYFMSLSNLLFLCGSLAMAASAVGSVHVSNLRCEYLREPLGVDEARPRLSWILQGTKRGERQTAFEVIVSSSPKGLERDMGDLWDSGRVFSDQTNQVEYDGKPLRARDQCFWKARSWDAEGRASDWSIPAKWTVGLLGDKNWVAEWIGVDGTGKAPRCLRKTFRVKARSTRRATVYVTALGLYELHLNGHRVGDHLLAPEWTNYFKRVQYQTFDVTPFVRTGRNALAATVGNGWYCGDWQKWQSSLMPIYGSEPTMRVQLEVEGEDGSLETTVSDRTWKGSINGPIRFAGIYEGETYDARKEMPGWDLADFDDSEWKSVSVAHPRVGQVEWQRSEPIRISQFIKPASVKEPKPGVFVFDLGQNIAGWCRMRLHEPSNSQVTFQFNEVLNPDGTVYMDNLHAGHLSSGDRQIDRYTCTGNRTEHFEPHFTYHGFRYVQVTGLHARPALDSLTGCVFHTGFTRTGSFTCSEPLLNRLASNIQWSQRANMMGVPTDCCQRDERCGYTGDAQFFVPTAVYNYDVAAFYNKWLVDVCEDSQLPSGAFADHAPTFGPGDNWNVGWSDAGIICPYTIWQTYGDTRVIRDHYTAMKRNLSLLKSASPTFVHTARVGNGDWLNLGGGASNGVIGTAYDAYDFRLMSEMATAIGETHDAQEFSATAGRFADAFETHFVEFDGTIKDSSQTGYALAFTMGLTPDPIKADMAARFEREIKRFDYHLATGFIGTPRLLPALHLAGHDDLAYRLLLQQTYPSWLYQVKLGATTMWERWDGWTPEKGYEDSGMNSFNHYAFGSAGEYLFGMVGGIRSIDPGYKKIRIEPVIQPGLSWAKVDYDSIQGKIASHWTRNAQGLTMDVEIPVNTKAIVCVPAKNRSEITESGGPIVDNQAIQYLRMEKGAAIFEIGSGHYRFASTGL